MAEIKIPELEALKADVQQIRDMLERVIIMPPPQWFGIDEAAEKLGVTPSTIRRKIASGEYEAKGTGKTRRVKIAA